jgi:hypothetical protein
VEYEAPAVPPRDGDAAAILVMMFVFGSAVMGYTGVYALLQADWSLGISMLGMMAGGLSLVPRLWRSRHRHVDPVTGKDPAIEATESRAMREALERYDRLLSEAQTVSGLEAGGESHPTRLPDEIKDLRFYEPTDRGYEAKIAARMKERGDPG